MLNFRCIKTVLLIDACLSLDDNTLCALYFVLFCTIFNVLGVFYSFLSYIAL